MLSPLRLLLGWLYLQQTRLVDIVTYADPLVSSSGMIPVDAGQSIVSAVHSASSHPEGVNSLTNKREERASSLVIPINVQNGVDVTWPIISSPGTFQSNEPAPNPPVSVTQNDDDSEEGPPLSSVVPAYNPYSVIGYQGLMPNEKSELISNPDTSTRMYVQQVPLMETEVIPKLAPVLKLDTETTDVKMKPVVTWNKPIIKYSSSARGKAMTEIADSNYKDISIAENNLPGPAIPLDDANIVSNSVADVNKRSKETKPADTKPAPPRQIPAVAPTSLPEPFSFPEEQITVSPRVNGESLFEVANTVEGGAGGLHLFQVGPPWRDEKIVGTFPGILGRITEVSFKAAEKLCRELNRDSDTAGRPQRAYLWSPINQYIPLLHKAFPVRQPEFAPECLKWVLRECRGTVRRPVLKPCTYWEPVRIHRPECGFNPDKETIFVNYRMPDFVPGNCPCVWPCTKRFDPIQRCRVTIPPEDREIDQIDADGDPGNEGEIEIQDILALQLCRSMRVARNANKIMSIGWLPIRAEGSDSGPGGGAAARKKREVHNSGQFHRSPKQLSKRQNGQQSSRNYKKRPQATKFINPDNGSIIDTGIGKNTDGFSQIVAYNPNEPQGDGAALQGRQGNRVNSCSVWKYKACPKSRSNSLDGRSIFGLSMKPANFTRAAFGKKKKPKQIAQRRKPVQLSGRQSDPNGDLPEVTDSTAECGKWKKAQGVDCLNEVKADTSLDQGAGGDEGGSSEEAGGTGNELSGRSSHVSGHGKRKMTVVKNLCPGSDGGFPCFLIRKRRSTVINIEVNDESEESDSEEEPVSPKGNRDDKILKKRQTDVGAEQGSSMYYSSDVKINQDPSCLCDWPCLPFFDKINRCYGEFGNLLLDKWGRNIIPTRSFRKSQRDPVACMNFVETDEIFCKMKEG